MATQWSVRLLLIVYRPRTAIRQFVLRLTELRSFSQCDSDGPADLAPGRSGQYLEHLAGEIRDLYG